jgi:hypothetical protein
MRESQKRLHGSFRVPSQPTGSAGPGVESNLSLMRLLSVLICSPAIYPQFTPGALFSHGDCAIVCGMMTTWREMLAGQFGANQGMTLLRQPANLSVHHARGRLQTSSRTLELIDGRRES